MSSSVASLLAAASAAAAGQQYPAGALYVVATPIGNLADITLRALHVLALVDAIACEDTRNSAALLARFGIRKPLIAVHEHNEREAAAGIVERLARGERVAYVSDAGTPALSDPGSVLVAAAQAARVRCIPVPGASGVTAALSVAGAALDGGFVFVGFLPPAASARDAALRGIARCAAPQVLFESPHRIAPLATALARHCGARRVTLCRELTKQFESVAVLAAGELPAWLEADADRRRGEFVLVLHAAAPASEADEAVQRAERTLDVLLAELPLKQAVALAARISGAARNVLYARALEWKARHGES